MRPSSMCSLLPMVMMMIMMVMMMVASGTTGKQEMCPAYATQLSKFPYCSGFLECSQEHEEAATNGQMTEARPTGKGSCSFEDLCHYSQGCKTQGGITWIHNRKGYAIMQAREPGGYGGLSVLQSPLLRMTSPSCLTFNASVFNPADLDVFFHTHYGTCNLKSDFVRWQETEKTYRLDILFCGVGQIMFRGLGGGDTSGYVHIHSVSVDPVSCHNMPDQATVLDDDDDDDDNHDAMEFHLGLTLHDRAVFYPYNHNISWCEPGPRDANTCADDRSSVIPIDWQYEHDEWKLTTIDGDDILDGAQPESELISPPLAPTPKGRPACLRFDFFLPYIGSSSLTVSVQTDQTPQQVLWRSFRTAPSKDRQQTERRFQAGQLPISSDVSFQIVLKATRDSSVAIALRDVVYNEECTSPCQYIPSQNGDSDDDDDDDDDDATTPTPTTAIIVCGVIAALVVVAVVVCGAVCWWRRRKGRRTTDEAPSLLAPVRGERAFSGDYSEVSDIPHSVQACHGKHFDESETSPYDLPEDDVYPYVATEETATTEEREGGAHEAYHHIRLTAERTPGASCSRVFQHDSYSHINAQRLDERGRITILPSEDYSHIGVQGSKVNDTTKRGQSADGESHLKRSHSDNYNHIPSQHGANAASSPKQDGTTKRERVDNDYHEVELDTHDAADEDRQNPNLLSDISSRKTDKADNSDPYDHLGAAKGSNTTRARDTTPQAYTHMDVATESTYNVMQREGRRIVLDSDYHHIEHL